jgi:signal peptidase II
VISKKKITGKILRKKNTKKPSSSKIKQAIASDSQKKRIKKKENKVSNKKGSETDKPVFFGLIERVPRWGAISSGASRWLWLTVIVVIVDQWSKSLIIKRLNEFDSITLFPMLDFMRIHNAGAAFSFLSDASGWQRWMFTTLGIAVSAVIFMWLRNLPARGQTLLAVSLAFIMGGALGNAIDRVLWGHVVDFIRVHYQQWFFPVFNIADSAITVGATLLILDTLLNRKS